MTITEKIFELSAPYRNQYQGPAPRMLFVCSVSMLRSPTAAHVAHAEYGWNTRSCGTSASALQRISTNLIHWADRIFFLDKEHMDQAMKLFSDDTCITSIIVQRGLVMNIEDEYEYMQFQLVNRIKARIGAFQMAGIL